MGALPNQSILFIAGDISGDIYSARLAEEVRLRNPSWVLHALGGKHLAAVINKGRDGEMVGDTSGCSAIGITASAFIYPKCWLLKQRLKSFLKSNSIDAVVMCDWGGFNCRVISLFKKAQIPVLYYFPPRSWGQNGESGLSIASQVTRVATPFEWSAKRLREAGCHAEWVGHPILENKKSLSDREILRREFGVGEKEKLVAILPGSRVSELRCLAPRLADVARDLAERQKIKTVVVVAEALVERVRSYFPGVLILADRAADALHAADAAMVKTGTATLEAAVMGVPQVAVYDFGWMTRIEWIFLWMWRWGKVPFIAMPNILLNRAAIPELYGLDCNPEKITEMVLELLNNEVRREQMQEDYGEIRRRLGEGLSCGATVKTAEMLEEIVG